MPQLLGETVFGLRPRVFFTFAAFTVACVLAFSLVVSLRPASPHTLIPGEYVRFEGDNSQLSYAVYRTSPIRWPTHRVDEKDSGYVFLTPLDGGFTFGLPYERFVTEVESKQ